MNNVDEVDDAAAEQGRDDGFRYASLHQSRCGGSQACGQCEAGVHLSFRDLDCSTALTAGLESKMAGSKVGA